MSDFAIRPAGPEDFALAIDWAAAEGWNPGLDDLEAFHPCDPQGFLMGWLGGRPVSSISVVRYGDDFGFLGFYIVHPDHRGAGLGWATWNAGLAHLAGRTIGLDGVVAQQDNYRRSGFEFAGRNVRFSGVPRTEATDSGGTEVKDFDPSALETLLAYDRAFYPAPRETFTRRWIAPGPGASRRTRIALRDGGVAGYGVIRACRAGYKIGPLFAEDRRVAGDLLAALCADLPADTEVSLDVPESNRPGTELAAALGLEPSFETARMYRGPAPELPTGRTFGLATFELG